MTKTRKSDITEREALEIASYLWKELADNPGYVKSDTKTWSEFGVADMLCECPLCDVRYDGGDLSCFGLAANGDQHPAVSACPLASEDGRCAGGWYTLFSRLSRLKNNVMEPLDTPHRSVCIEDSLVDVRRSLSYLKIEEPANIRLLFTIDTMMGLAARKVSDMLEDALKNLPSEPS